MTEEKKPFTVSDRRHFTPEGEARQPAEEPAAPPAAKAPAVPATAEHERARGGTAGIAEPDRVEPPAAERDAVAPMDFVGLLVSLAAQASFLISPEPGSGVAPDLAGARSVIGLLEILREKTEGRRTPDEDRVIEGLLYELRMAFVSRTRADKA